MSPSQHHSRRDLDDVIHSPVRLSIMATLARMGDTDFQFLKELLDVSDSLLSKHTTVLEGAGYVEVVKSFVHKRPTTRFNLTVKGKKAYAAYLAALKDIVGDEVD